MAHPLDDVEAKLERAKEHIAAADEQVRAFVGGDVSVNRLVPDDGSLETATFAHEHETREVPRRLRIVAGEAVHQLRTALDHLVHRMILASNGTPHGRNGFPVYEYAPSQRQEQKRFGNLIAGVSPQARAFIVECQPYQAKAPPVHALAVLKAMNDADKHETLLLTVARVVPKMVVRIPGGYVVTAPGDSMGLAFGRTTGATVSQRLEAQVVCPRFGDHENVPVWNGLMALHDFVATEVVSQAKARLFSR